MGTIAHSSGLEMIARRYCCKYTGETKLRITITVSFNTILISNLSPWKIIPIPNMAIL